MHEGCSEDFCIFFFLSILDTLFLLYIGLVAIWHTLYLYLVYIYIDVCYFTYLSMCCLFSLFIHMFLILLYAIYYFCFTQRCRDEFCLKCFKNTGCQSLLAINSLLTKFFKSLC